MARLMLGFGIIDRPWNSPPRQVASLCRYETLTLSNSGEEFYVTQGGTRARDAGVLGVWRIAANGTERVRLPLSEEEEIRDWLARRSMAPGRQKVHQARHTRRPGGADLTPGPEVHPAKVLALMGRRIAYAGYTDDGESLWVLDVETGQPSLILAEAPVTIVPRWSPDGSRLALKLLGCVRGPKGWMSVPADEAWRMRPSLEMISLSSGEQPGAALPPGYLDLGAWG